MNFFSFETPGEAIGKGLTTGGLAVAAIYGLKKLRKFIEDQLNIAPRVYHKDIKRVFMPFPERPDMEKQSILKEPLLYGLSVPIGAYGVYKLLDYLEDTDSVYKTRNMIRALEKKYDNAYENLERMGETKVLKKKLKEDKELNEYVDNLLEPQELSKHASFLDTWGFGDISRFITTDMMEKWMPAIIGGLVPLGALSGYYFAKYMNDKEVEDTLETPKLNLEYTNSPADVTSFSVFRPKKLKRKVYKITEDDALG